MISDKALVQCEVLHAHGVTYASIAKIIGVTTQALHDRRKKHPKYVNRIKEKLAEVMVVSEYERISDNIGKNNGGENNE